MPNNGDDCEIKKIIVPTLWVTDNWYELYVLATSKAMEKAILRQIQ